MVDVPAVPMAFDEQSGVVVALFDDAEAGMQTWTFDVEATAWTQRSTAGFASTWTRLVYDPSTDLHVAVTESGATQVYDLATDTWTPRASLPGSPELAALDTRTGRIVVPTNDPAGGVRVWSYSVVDDTWEEIDQSDDARPAHVSPLLFTYAPTIDAFVALTRSGPLARTTHTFAADSAVWSEVDTRTPSLSFVWNDLPSGTEMVYAPVSDRVIVFTDGVVAEYDPVEQTWVTDRPDTEKKVEGAPVGPLVRLNASLVYDSVHQRVLVYGGTARMSDGWTLLDDLWAYDPVTHDWSMVLDASQSRLVNA